MLCCCVSLLTASDLSRTSTLPLAEQLLYLACGDHALSELDHLQQPPPPPQGVGVPPELWEVLNKIPLSLDYYNAVLHSLQTHPQFWEGVVGESADVGDFSAFPWRGGASVVGVGLDDYVMLRCLDEKSCMAQMADLMEPLVNSMTVPLLGEVLQASSSEPTLLLYQELCPLSQALLSQLEQHITTIFKVQCTVEPQCNEHLSVWYTGRLGSCKFNGCTKLYRVQYWAPSSVL